MSELVLVLGQLVQLLNRNIVSSCIHVTMHELVFACTRNANQLLKQLSLSAHFLHMTAHYCWEWSHTQAPLRRVWV